MPAKRAKPVVIETPFPSAEQFVRTLRRLDDAETSILRSKLAREAKKAAEFYRYDALTKWLRNQKKDRVKLCFEDLEDEDVIGMTLPYTAWDRAWWTNERDRKSTQSRAWLDAGWKVQSVDPDREIVSFVRANNH